MASWYGPNFHGRLTANGEVYNQYSLTAANPTLPLPCYARVTNEDTGDSVIVRVNDRGPVRPGPDHRPVDRQPPGCCTCARPGVAKVRVKYVGMAPLDGDDSSYLDGLVQARLRRRALGRSRYGPGRRDDGDERDVGRGPARA